jgi:hypothetical protein
MKKTLKALMIATVLLTACKKNDPEPEIAPTVSTQAPVKVNDSTYTCGGNVSDEGSAPVTERGVVVSLSPDPAVNDANDVKVTNGSGAGAFSMPLDPFYQGYTYHIRAYATNSVGVSYGADVTVTPGGGTNPGTGCPVINVTGPITSPTTWTSGNVYMVNGSLTIQSVLTIQPGVIVKLSGNNVNGSFDVQSGGKVIANGTAAGRIVFTSVYDDSYCGDSNGDGNATTPAKGDWNDIELDGGTNNSFTYCDFFYGGGYNGYVVFIGVSSAAFTFDHCTFAHTKNTTSSYAAFNGNSYMADPGVSVFTNNVLYDNDKPIIVNSYYTLDPSNSFHNPANPSQGNKRNGIFMTHFTNPANATVSWNESEVPYVMDVNFNGGGSGATGAVNIGNNVVVKFTNSSAGISKGSSRTVNIGAGAVLTSFKDDTRGGDTNGDGSASSPAAGDWDGFWNYASGAYVSGAYIFYAAH